MGGGVSPFEWILPPVALSHVAYNEAVSPVAEAATGVKGLDVNTPGSQAQQLGEAQAQAENDANVEQVNRASRFLTDTSQPQTPQQERNARKRAEAAGRGRSGARRASQYLASDVTTVGTV